MSRIYRHMSNPCDVNAEQLWDSKNAGDVVYAFAAEFHDNGEKRELRPPEKGVLAVYADETMNANYLRAHHGAPAKPRFFVPIDGATGEPDWDGVRTVHYDLFADDYGTAKAAYVTLLGAAAARLQARLNVIRDAIGEACQETAPDASVEPVWRADLAPDRSDMLARMGEPLGLRPGMGPMELTWDEFTDQRDRGILSDTKGAADLVVDGLARADAVMMLNAGYVRVRDDYMIPFGRLPEFLPGHVLTVHWWTHGITRNALVNPRRRAGKE